MRVFVYFNLHKHLWSLKALDGPSKGRVIAHCKTVRLADCEFKVSESGRQRVLRDNRKNVHAGIVGRRITRLAQKCRRAVTYNPYRAGTFVDRDTRTAIFSAPCAILKDRQVYVPI